MKIIPQYKFQKRLDAFSEDYIMRDFVADGNRLYPFHGELGDGLLLSACGDLTRTGSKTGCQSGKSWRLNNDTNAVSTKCG
jgi:hypothetical protein